MGGEDKPFIFKTLIINPHKFKHGVLRSIQVRGIFEAILITIKGNIYFYIASLVLTQPLPRADPTNHAGFVGHSSSSTPPTTHLSQICPLFHIAPAKYFSKTTKPSVRETSSHNFPNLSTTSPTLFPCCHLKTEQNPKATQEIQAALCFTTWKIKITSFLLTVTSFLNFSFSRLDSENIF